MLRKFLASLGIVATLATLMPMTAVAAAGDVTVTLSASTVDVFSTTAPLVVSYKSKAGTLDVSIMNGATVVKQLLSTTIAADMADPIALTAWNGKDTAGNYVVDGTTYTVVATLTGVNADVNTKALTLASTLTPTVTLSYGAAGYFDPGSTTPFAANYTLPLADANLTINIKTSADILVYTTTVTSSLATGSFSWDGRGNTGSYSGKFVPAEVSGTVYKAAVTSSKTGFTTGTSTESTFTVKYNSGSKPVITGFNVVTTRASGSTTFDPEYEFAIINFSNTKTSNLTLEVLNSGGTVVATFYDYNGDEYEGNGDTLEVVWDGKDQDGNDLSPKTGTFTVKLTAENSYGAATASKTVTLDNTLETARGSFENYNDDITVSVNDTFEPDDDEDGLKVSFDVKRDLDEVKAYAINGNDVIEIDTATNLTSDDSDQDMYWDGTDEDGDYVQPGRWRIELRSKQKGLSVIRYAGDLVKVTYEKPAIDEIKVSKSSFDPSNSEQMYVMFKTDKDALVDVYPSKGGVKDDNIQEDMEVTKDRWYAVLWDGGSYDAGESVDLYIKAKNLVNENVYDTASKSVSIVEDKTSDNKPTVTMDAIAPVLVVPGGEMEIMYNIDMDSTVTVTIYKGETAGSTALVTVVDDEEQEAGDHVVTWNGEDKSGKSLSSSQEFYSYKVEAKEGGTDSEKGMFIVTSKIGEIFGEIDFSGDDTGDDDTGDDDTGATECAGFSDVASTSKYCTAIQWAVNAGIFQGYNDGTFRPYMSINRMEMLKVLLQASNVNILNAGNSTLGFIDVIPGAWYMPYLSTAKSFGIFSGDAGGRTARPGDYVNRAESLKLMFETLKVAQDYSISYCAFSPYSDVTSNAWFRNYTCAAQQYSLFETFGSMLNPSAYASRGEIAQALYNLHTAGL